MKNWIFAYALLGSMLWGVAFSVSPSPVQCGASGCSLRNHLGVWPDRTSCKAAEVLYPRTEEELVSAVAYGTKLNRKMKVVSKWSQSIPKLVCPGGDSGLIITTRDLNSDIVVNLEKNTVTADAGVLLRTLVDRIAEVGYALPAATYFDSVSVAGAVSTGAHGSSLWGRGSALHEYVVGISLVVPASAQDAFAKVIRLDDSHSSSKELLDATKLSLGVLGAISKVTFTIEPMFKRSATLELRNDDQIEHEVVKFGAEFEFGDVCWHPGRGKALFKMDSRVPADTPGEGVNKYAGFQPVSFPRVEQIRQAEDKFEQAKDTKSLCGLAELILSTRVPSGNGYLNDGVNFSSFPVVGFNNLMQTAGGCQDAAPTYYIATATGLSSTTFEQQQDGYGGENQSLDSEICSWDPRVAGNFYHQTAFSIPLDKVRDFILDVKKLRDVNPESFCGLSVYGGIYMRFVKKSEALLGQREDAVEFDMTYYRARSPSAPRLHEDVVEEIEQMGLIKYQGRPHFGKNRNLAFAQTVGERVRDLERFMRAKQELDPAGLFSSEWSDAVLSGDKEKILSSHDHCALEGMCICSEDRHCAPERGYICRAGRVFESARVCRYEPDAEAAIL